MWPVLVCFFIIAALSQNTHTCATRVFKHVQKSALEQTHNYKTAIHRSKLKSRGKGLTGQMMCLMKLFLQSLFLSLSPQHKLCLGALKYADNYFHRPFILPALEKKIWFQL